MKEDLNIALVYDSLTHHYHPPLFDECINKKVFLIRGNQ